MRKKTRPNRIRAHKNKLQPNQQRSKQTRITPSRARQSLITRNSFFANSARLAPSLGPTTQNTSGSSTRIQTMTKRIEQRNLQSGNNRHQKTYLTSPVNSSLRE